MILWPHLASWDTKFKEVSVWLLTDSIKPPLWQTFLHCSLNLLKTGNPKQFHLPTYTSIFVFMVCHIKIH